MGPQLGYYYPEIVQQMHLQGAGINAQGAFVPGLAMYMLLGRTNNYAWSLTSAGHDVRDVYALPLCGSKGKRAKRTSNRYRYKGKCRSFTSFNAGKLGGKELKFKKSVHGAVIGTATVKGKAYAFARKRSTFGRDALNLAALKDMTEGKGTTPASFYEVRQPVRLHVQLGLHQPHHHGQLLVRPAAGAAEGAWTAACPRWAPASTSGRATSSRASTPTRPAGPRGCC